MLQHLTEERPWGLVRCGCGRVATVAARLRARCSKEKICVSSLGGIAFLLLILFRAAVMSSPLAQAGLTNAEFIFFLGKKKKREKEVGKQIFMSKNCKTTFDSLYLAPKCFLLSLKISPALPRWSPGPVAENRHFKEWAGSSTGKSPCTTKLPSVLSQAAAQSQGDYFEITTHLNV